MLYINIILNQFFTTMQWFWWNVISLIRPGNVQFDRFHSQSCPLPGPTTKNIFPTFFSQLDLILISGRAGMNSCWLKSRISYLISSHIALYCSRIFFKTKFGYSLYFSITASLWFDSMFVRFQVQTKCRFTENYLFSTWILIYP